MNYVKRKEMLKGEKGPDHEKTKEEKKKKKKKDEGGKGTCSKV